MVWGDVTGRDAQLPDMLTFYNVLNVCPRPGMLVSSHAGMLYKMRDRGHDRPGLGIIVGVLPHPKPRGDIKWLCSVIWNW